MEQNIYCAMCGRKIFDVDDDETISYLRGMVEGYHRCDCGSNPGISGVRFE